MNMDGMDRLNSALAAFWKRFGVLVEEYPVGFSYQSELDRVVLYRNGPYTSHRFPEEKLHDLVVLMHAKNPRKMVGVVLWNVLSASPEAIQELVRLFDRLHGTPTQLH